MSPPADRRIFSVSELTRKLKHLIEDRFSLIWISGEVSNFQIPASGHYYFTLKDGNAQIRAIMFRMQAAHLTFNIKNGLHITGFGRVGVYAPRGTYQFIFEYLEPRGIGRLYVEFEQLKARLLAEGLFEVQHKKKLPLWPGKISIITSPTGAVVHDIIRIIRRRQPNIALEIVPVKVQGDDAVEQIVNGIDLVNRRGDADLVIIARGGGSFEDFHAFNSEAVARSLFSLAVPVISGVGHETDNTIVDFVADVRAPTPSAAAELAVPDLEIISRRVQELNTMLKRGIERRLDFLRNQTNGLAIRISNPQKKIQEQHMRLDDALTRMVRTVKNSLNFKREQLLWRRDKLEFMNPVSQIQKHKLKLENTTDNLKKMKDILIKQLRDKNEALSGCLRALSPYEILSRGYSITRKQTVQTIITDPSQVKTGERLEVLVSKGQFNVKVIDD